MTPLKTIISDETVPSLMRRGRTVLLAVLLLAGLISLGQAHTVHGADRTDGGPWRDFRGGPGNPGSRDLVLVPEGSEPRVNWSRQLDSGVTSPVTGDGTGLYVGTINGTLFKLDPGNGHTIWKRELGGSIDAAPLVMEGGASVVAATSEGLVMMLSSANGSSVWTWATPTGGRIFSSPKEHDGRIYFGSYDSSFYCLHASNGTVAWTYPGCEGYIHTTPAIAELEGRAVVLFGACDGTMNCLDARDGEVLWSFVTAYIPSSPSVSGGKVHFGSYDSRFFCLGLGDGKEVWNRSLPDDVYSSPAVLDDRVAVGSNDGSLLMFDAANGDVLWNRTLTEGALESSPLLFRDMVAVTTGDGMVLLDPGSGNVRSGFELGNAADISPTYIGDSLIFGDSSGWVRRITATDERVAPDDDGDDDGWEVPFWALFLSINVLFAIALVILIALRIRLCRLSRRGTG
jgi:outer membrane protein assembly factor BamB